MKHWINNNSSYITLSIASDKYEDKERILSIQFHDNNFYFNEECDGWFSTTASKEEAIEALEEAIQWIKGH